MVKVKYLNSFPGMDTRYSKLLWQPGEVKDLIDSVANDLVENKDFIIVSDDFTVKPKKKLKDGGNSQ